MTNKYKGLDIIRELDKMNVYYLDRIERTLAIACSSCNRTYAIRVDLRLPNNDNLDSEDRDCIYYSIVDKRDLMKRFFESLNSKIKCQYNRKVKDSIRVHKTKVRYIWVREEGKSGKPHYHVCLLLNKDRFYRAGNIEDKESLSFLIISAWASALRLRKEEVVRLIHFPINHGYYLERNNHKSYEVFNSLFYRLSYFAKKESKKYGEGYRNIGTSIN
ncbi:inovirus Gp2 family protein [Vibrio sp.]|nr:inovirus Gp2 family protein [Vibrio sp.]